MALPVSDFYSTSSLSHIISVKEKMGKLRNDYFSPEIKALSKKLKEKRNEREKLKKNEREDITLEIEDLKEEMQKLKLETVAEVAGNLSSGKCDVNIELKDGFYVTGDMVTMLMAQIIKLELQRCYKIHPVDRNTIIEQLHGLLDNPMPKIIIRGDVCHFFDNIQQDSLIKTLTEDGFVSRITVRYLKKILNSYNLNENKGDQHIGIPKGLDFSPYLAELYLSSIDKAIRRMDGIYYYKRYVDDIIIVASPSVETPEIYWEKIRALFEEKGLDLHSDSGKKYLKKLDGNGAEANFEYLGYSFLYSDGKLNVLMAEKRYNKYHDLIDAIFDVYSKCSHYRSGKDKKAKKQKNKHRDALAQLMDRLKVLTGNGFLTGKKNYVATGIYYSNKYVTDFRQLKELDAYLSQVIDDSQKFNPPRNLFNYGEGNGYEENLLRIKEKLHSFSFMEGFSNRRACKKERYNRVLLDLKRMHLAYKKR